MSLFEKVDSFFVANRKYALFGMQYNNTLPKWVIVY